MEQQLSIDQKIELIVKKFEEYNDVNQKIKRFGDIFNTFTFTYEITKPKIFLELKSTDKENTLQKTSNTTEKWVELNVQNDDQVNWVLKTVSRFTEKAIDTMKKAREISKPHVGILVYDEYTDSYYLNPTTGPLLLKTKDIAREILSTRIDIFNIFINLRSAVMEEDRRAEIENLSLPKVFEKIKNALKSIISISIKIMKIEGIPRYVAEIEHDDNKIIYNTYITVDFGLEAADKNKVNELNLEANLDNFEELEKIYIQVRKDEEVSKNMVNLARDLVSKNDPRLYDQNSITGLWYLTKEGKKTMKDLNIIEFINNDISEIMFTID